VCNLWSSLCLLFVCVQQLLWVFSQDLVKLMNLEADKNYQKVNGGFVPYPVDTQLPKQYPQETKSETKDSKIQESS
jgi:hypothetical protein